MKKNLRLVLVVSVIFCMSILSACSDFAFNPLGKWKFESYTVNGEENINEIMGMYSGSSLYLVFEKSGTAYFMMNNEQLDMRTTYTYEYDDNSITLTVYDTLTKVSQSQQYTVSEDKQSISYTIKSDDNSIVETRTYKRV